LEQSNGGWEDDFPLQMSDLEVPAVIFPRKEAYCRRLRQQVSESFALNFNLKELTERDYSKSDHVYSKTKI